LVAFHAVSGPEIGERGIPHRSETRERWRLAVYGLALAVSVGLWFQAIRAPLWLDETLSYFFIKGGFREIVPRQGWPDVPVYSYLLWLWTKVVGTGEIALRMSSAAAMLGAVYLLYRSAREMFDHEAAIIAAIIFCLHPITVFASIDVRPYAFATLTITVAIFALVRLRVSSSIWLAALFGLSAACILYFQVLFAVLLPALAACFFALRLGPRRISWWQLGVGLCTFSLAALAAVPGLQYLLHTTGAHAFTLPPKLADLRSTLVLGRGPAFVLAGTLVLAAVLRKLDVKSRFEVWPFLLCVSLALVPAVLLYGISVGTSVHIFVGRYRIVAVPGIALLWAWIMSRIDSRTLRLLFCIAVVMSTFYQDFRSPYSRLHGYSWKYALSVADKSTAADNAPLLIASDLPESDQMALPVGAAVKDNALFAPLTYYPVSAPVTALPRSLNDEAKQIATRFLEQAGQGRFLALGFMASYDTLNWLAAQAGPTHEVHLLGDYDGVRVVEFLPRKERVQP
jgi:hypothetical protein